MSRNIKRLLRQTKYLEVCSEFDRTVAMPVTRALMRKNHYDKSIIAHEYRQSSFLR